MQEITFYIQFSFEGLDLELITGTVKRQRGRQNLPKPLFEPARSLFSECGMLNHRTTLPPYTGTHYIVSDVCPRLSDVCPHVHSMTLWFLFDSKENGQHDPCLFWEYLCLINELVLQLKKSSTVVCNKYWCITMKQMHLCTSRHSKTQMAHLLSTTLSWIVLTTWLPLK